MVRTRSSARLVSGGSSDGESGSSNKGFYDNLPPDRVEKPHKKKRGRKAIKPRDPPRAPLNIPIRMPSSVSLTVVSSSGASSTTSGIPVATVAPVSVINYPASVSTTVPSVLQPTVNLTHHGYSTMAPNSVPSVQRQPQVPVITSQCPQNYYQWLMSRPSNPEIPLDNVPLSRLSDIEHSVAASYISNTMKVGNNRYPIHPDVKFKRLPFYQEIAELMKPSSLVPKTETGVQENTFYFHLTPQQAQLIMNAPEANVMQAQLRFCKIETSCEQDDCFPPSIGVKINNRVCPLPMPIPTNKCYVEPKRPPGPVNITSLLKLSPTVANQIVITWMNDFMTRYAVTVNFVKKLTPTNLLSRLKSKGTKNPDYTRSLIKEKLREDLDCEIATTSLRVSLVCPLGKMRMMCPCRPLTCIHLQCFDASVFLAMNEKKPSWVCPVCDKPALYDNLVVDGYFLEVLSSARLAAESTEIQLHKDGSWSAHIKTDIVPQQIFNDVEVIADDDVIPLSDGSDSSSGLPSLKRGAGSRDGYPDQPSPRPPPTSSNSGAPAGSATVDLTSDSDDDLPLRRKIPKKSQDLEADTTSDKDSESDKSGGKKTKRHSSLDLAVSSIISLDSPSPLTVPTSPNGSSSEAPMIIETDPIMDLDAETTEALKTISSMEQPIDLETPERISPPGTPFDTSPDSPKSKDNTPQEDPIGVNIESKIDEENEDDTEEPSPTKSVTPERMPIEALEKLIDIAHTSETNETEMPDPLEIEEAVCDVPAASESFDDGEDHRIDFVKDPIQDVLAKDNEHSDIMDDKLAGGDKNGDLSNSSRNMDEAADCDEVITKETSDREKDDKGEKEEKSSNVRSKRKASKRDSADEESDSEDEEDSEEEEDSESDSESAEDEEEEGDGEGDGDGDGEGDGEEEDEEEEENEPETIVDTVP